MRTAELGTVSVRRASASTIKTSESAPVNSPVGVPKATVTG